MCRVTRQNLPTPGIFCRVTDMVNKKYRNGINDR